MFYWQRNVDGFQRAFTNFFDAPPQEQHWLLISLVLIFVHAAWHMPVELLAPSFKP